MIGPLGMFATMMGHPEFMMVDNTYGKQGRSHYEDEEPDKPAEKYVISLNFQNLVAHLTQSEAEQLYRELGDFLGRQNTGNPGK